ncbi:hypothetical protein SAMN05216378_1970 [Paenibacillus catalpae]|uniref:Uncharacterized protein n=1 Tax=Paenibacillus catalpae TaxID=1045775 RepID=A0A1I1X1K9_9BACL|nr:hypothetical protein [Paenibacillus catalpae]SFE01212.1 hypothetical protein SAMN05216378_1970 [Paenibacillus catalpae]
MIHQNVKTYKYRVGHNNYIVINIYQSASATAEAGNVLASNAVNVQIMKQLAKQKKRKR